MPIALLLMLSHFYFWPSPIDWQMNQSNVAVAGSVIDEASGRVIDGAVVDAMSGADVQRTVSNSNGRFIFLTLLPGTYRICAAKSGYAPNCHPQDSEPTELFAGFEYGATVVLSR